MNSFILGFSEVCTAPIESGVSYWERASAIAIVATVIVAIFQLIRLGKQVETSAISLGADAIQSAVHQRYTERKLTLSAVELPNHGKTEKLRVAKTIALKQALTDNPDTWRTNSSILGHAGAKWENIVSFDTAQALQDIGEAVLMGIVPVDYALSVLADQFIDDWIICHWWVRSYRLSERIKVGIEGKSQEVAINELVENAKEEDTDGDVAIFCYHRRHAEWIAIMAALWVNQRGFRFSRASKLFSLYKGGKSGALHRFDQITQLDKSLMPASVQLKSKKISKWGKKNSLNPLAEPRACNQP